MSEPYLAEVRMVGFNFAPRGWALCDGQILPIDQNQSLYSLLGTQFGGDGRTSFALPDMRGRTPIHVSSAHALGSKSGEEAVTLSTDEIPSHTHNLRASTENASTPTATGHYLADETPEHVYGPVSNPVNMSSSAVTTVGGNQGHNNMQPFLTINFVIALTGMFPPRN